MFDLNLSLRFIFLTRRLPRKKLSSFDLYRVLSSFFLFFFALRNGPKTPTLAGLRRGPFLMAAGRARWSFTNPIITNTHNIIVFAFLSLSLSLSPCYFFLLFFITPLRFFFEFRSERKRERERERNRKDCYCSCTDHRRSTQYAFFFLISDSEEDWSPFV